MIIYKTTNLENGKIYIGKDMHNDPLYLGSGKLLKQAIKKYGKEMFIKEIVEECTYSNIDEREIFWINYYNSRKRNIGYNIANGGTGGDTISNHPNKKEIGLRHSEKLKGKSQNKKNRKLCTEETRNKLSIAALGENNPMYGKHHTNEAKQKISLKQKQRDPESRVVSEITKQKISASNIGKTMSEDTKRKISISNSGEKNGFFGKTHTPENIEKFKKIGSLPKSLITRKKISESNKGKYYGSQNKPFIANGIEFRSIGECFKITNEPIHIIRKKLKNNVYVYIKSSS